MNVVPFYGDQEARTAKGEMNSQRPIKMSIWNSQTWNLSWGGGCWKTQAKRYLQPYLGRLIMNLNLQFADSIPTAEVFYEIEE